MGLSKPLHYGAALHRQRRRRIRNAQLALKYRRLWLHLEEQRGTTPGLERE